MSLKLFHIHVFIAIVKQGRHGLLPTSLAAMSVFVVMMFFAVVRLCYHVALNQPLYQQVALFSIHLYIHISGLVWMLFLK